MLYRTILVSLLFLIWNINAESGLLLLSTTEEIEKQDKGMEQVENDESDILPWAVRDHFFWDIGFGGSTLMGIEFSTGIGFCFGLIGVHLDYDYHHEFTWTVHPAEKQKIFSLLVGPAFRLRWFRIHLTTGIGFVNYRSRGDLASIDYAYCESPAGCLLSDDNYYHEEIEGYSANWPVAVKWYFALNRFGVGMKLQTNVNNQCNTFSIGAMFYTLILRPDTPSNKKIKE